MAIYRVRTVFSGMQGAPYLNTLFFLTTGGTAQQAVTAAGAFWNGVDARMADNATWATEAEVPTLNEATGALQAVDTTTPVTGSGAALDSVMPPATQGLIRWVTGGFVGGRRVRGRTFVPATTEAQWTEGLLEAAASTAWANAASALIADASSELAIWHRPVNGVGGSNHLVTSSSVWNQAAVLRSRRD